MLANMEAIAKALNLTAAEVAVLPAVLERMSQSVNLFCAQFAAQCVTNARLREYVGQVVRKVAQTEEGKEAATAVLGKTAQ